MLYKSPAKINLGLWVGEKQDDGYHPINTIFVPVTLYDNISITENSSDEIRILCNMPGVPLDETNICWKAADRYFKKAGFSKSITISMQKIIPHGGGLGGGSSNAAVVLEHLWGTYGGDLNRAELFHIAKGLGADVPFFLEKTPCNAKGIGEILKPVEIPWLKDKGIVLIIPEVSVSTSEAYTEFDKLNIQCEEKRYDKIVENIYSLEEADKHIVNDFEKVLFPIHPELQAIKELLKATGAGYASMTGTGSVVYGIFETEIEAANALAGISNRYLAYGALPIIGTRVDHPVD